MTPVYVERASGFRREWAAVPGLRRLMADIERQTSPDTRVVLAEVTIQMLPYTAVQLDLGHRDVVLEEDGTDRRAHDDTVYTVQVYGFENKLQVGAFAIDAERRWLYVLLIFFVVVFVIYTIFVFLVL